MVAPRNIPGGTGEASSMIGLPLDENDGRYLHEDNKQTSTVPPPPPPADDSRDTSITTTAGGEPTSSVHHPSSSSSPSSSHHQVALESRVQELEEKLATLSLLLTRQRLMNHSSHNQHNNHIRPVSPSDDHYDSNTFTSITPPPSSPPLRGGNSSDEEQQEETQMMGSTRGNHPVLDSPAPARLSLLDGHGRRRRNLSFRILQDACSSSSADSSPATAVQTMIDEVHAEEAERRRQNLAHGGDGIYLPKTLPDNRDHDYYMEGSSPEEGTTQTTTHVQTGHEQQLRQRRPKLSQKTTSPTQSVVAATTIPDILVGTNDTQFSVDGAKKSKRITKEESTMSTTDQAEESRLTNEKRKETDTKSKWLDYLNSVQESNYDTDKQMEEFVKVPSAVESLLSFGFWICVDSFLYILTILPIRFVWSCLLLIRYVGVRLFRRQVPEGPFRFHRRHSYQLIQVSIIYIIYKFALMRVSIGMLYHWIRGQAMVKLYVLIAMVEIFDRLLCSLGQDCLDSLYWNTTRRPRSSRLIVSAIVVLVYTMVHSFLLFVHLATLHVAINSDDQALISLLIGGNFAEIKSTVFKKYNKATLFKITASDICERFKLALYLVLVLILNMAQGMDEKTIWNYVNMCGIVWCAEWLSDWIKHAFITKFNYISSKIYPEYALLLAGDLTGFGHEGVNLDNSHAVVKRIGFAQLPLVCVLARYLKEAFKYGSYNHPPSTLMVIAGFVTCWSVLLVCKLSLGSFLQKKCRTKLESAPEFSKKNASVAKKAN